MSTTLEIFSRQERVEEELRGAAGRTSGACAVVLGEGWVTRRQLIEAASRCVGLGGRRVGALGERILVDAVSDEARDSLRPLVGTRGFSDGLSAVFAAWKRAGVSPEAARFVTRSSAGGAHAAEVVRLLGSYARRLGDRADESDGLRAAATALADPSRDLPMLRGVERVVFHDVDALDAGELAIVDALVARGLRVELRYPSGLDRPSLEIGVRPLQERFERAENPLIDLVPVALPESSDGPLGRFLGSLFRPRSAVETLPPVERVAPKATAAAGGQQLGLFAWPEARKKIEEPPVTLVAAPSPDVEARTAARWVRDLLDDGVSPDEVIVVARSDDRRRRVQAWLRRYGVPTVERAGPSVASAPPVRVALRVYDLLEDGLPREDLIALYSSRYVSEALAGAGTSTGLPASRVARVLRQAGVRDGSDEDGQPGYRRRLAEHARAARPEEQPAIARAATQVDRLVSRLRALPEQATIAAHAAALTRLLEDFDLQKRASGDVDRGATVADPVEIARDQAAVAALLRVLGDLGRAADTVGVGKRRVPRLRFARLLAGALGDERITARGARGGAIELAVPERVIGRRFAYLCHLGIEDGEVPLRHLEDPILGDDARRAINRALGVTALPVSLDDDAREPLRFVLTLAAGAHLHLSYCTADSDGKPLAPSHFVDELRRALGRDADKPAHDPVPRAREARTPSEMLARASLDLGPCATDPSTRLSSRDPAVDATLGDSLRARFPEVTRQIDLVSDIERARLRFFADPDAAPSPWAGGVSFSDEDPAVLSALREALAARMPGREALALSPTALEEYAQCGFRFFARRVLQSRPVEEAGDDLDPMTAGRLHHKVLERFFRRLHDDHRFPLRGDAADHALLDETADAVFADWSERRGHPALFAARTRRVRRELHDLVAAEAANRPFDKLRPDLTPSWFEHSFTLAVPGESGEPTLHLKGTIDRVDVATGRLALVIDYKSGRVASHAKKLGEDALLITSFQLPIYAAAIQAQLQVPAVAATYYAIRDAKATKMLEAPAATSLALGPGNEGTLGAALHALRTRMLDGDFAIRPRTCDYCELAACCRVVVRRIAPDGD